MCVFFMLFPLLAHILTRNHVMVLLKASRPSGSNVSIFTALEMQHSCQSIICHPILILWYHLPFHLLCESELNEQRISDLEFLGVCPSGGQVCQRSGNSDHVVCLIHVASTMFCSFLYKPNIRQADPNVLHWHQHVIFRIPQYYTHTIHRIKMPRRQFSVLALPPTFHPFHSPSPDRSDLLLCPKAVKHIHPLLLLHQRMGSQGITARPVGSLRSSGIAKVMQTGIEGGSWRL